jgi:hypothetical protein
MKTKQEALDLLQMLMDMQKIRPTNQRADRINQIKKENLGDIVQVDPTGKQIETEHRCYGCIESFQRTMTVPLQSKIQTTKNKLIKKKYEKALIEAQITIDTMREIIQSGDDDIEERVKGLALRQRQVIDSILGKKP